MHSDSDFHGWVHLGLSSEVAPGTAISIRRFGVAVELQRQKDGTLVLGGDVRSRFRALRTPGDRHGDQGTGIQEHSGVVFGYHQGSRKYTGEVPSIPTALLAALAETDQSRWVSFVRVNVPASLPEVAENSADQAHFAIVHRSSVRAMTGMQAAVAETGIELRANMLAVGSRKPREFTIHFLDAFNSVVQVDSPILKRPETVALLAPSSDRNQDLLMRISCQRVNPIVDRIARAAYRSGARRGVEEDAPIWRKKKALEHPVVSDADGPLLQFRSWHSQHAVLAGGR